MCHTSITSGSCSKKLDTVTCSFGVQIGNMYYCGVAEAD